MMQDIEVFDLSNAISTYLKKLSINPKIKFANIPTITVTPVTPNSPLNQMPKFEHGNLYF